MSVRHWKILSLASFVVIFSEQVDYWQGSTWEKEREEGAMAHCSQSDLGGLFRFFVLLARGEFCLEGDDRERVE